MELLVVIVIIVILASIVWVSLEGMREAALDANIRSNMSQLRSVAERAADPHYDNVCDDAIFRQLAFVEMTVANPGEGYDNVPHDGSPENHVTDEHLEELPYESADEGDLSYAHAICRDHYNNWCIEAHLSELDGDGNPKHSLCVDRVGVHGDENNSYKCTDEAVPQCEPVE